MIFATTISYFATKKAYFSKEIAIPTKGNAITALESDYPLKGSAPASKASDALYVEAHTLYGRAKRIAVGVTLDVGLLRLEIDHDALDAGNRQKGALHGGAAMAAVHAVNDEERLHVCRSRRLASRS